MKTANLIVLLFILQIVDLISTLVILGKGGVEANPVMAQVLELGNIWFVVIKMGIATIACAILYHYREKCKHLVRTGVILCVVVYSILAAWHCYLLYFASLYF